MAAPRPNSKEPTFGWKAGSDWDALSSPVNALKRCRKDGTGMKKNTRNETTKSKREAKKVAELEMARLVEWEANKLVIGIDLGDRNSAYCVRTRDQLIVKEGTVATTATAIFEAFQGVRRQRLVIETGTHSRWVAQLLELMGHEVIVANARKLKLISENNQKSDKVDARLLSQLGCMNVDWLHPVYQRSQDAHSDLMLARSREALVETRTGLINHVRGSVKSFGNRLVKCGSERFVEVAQEALPDRLRPALSGVLATLEVINEQIYAYDCQIEHLCHTKYKEAAKCLLQVNGVGPVTTLTYVLTIEDKDRFEHSRDVGPYLGLVRKNRQSGERDPQLGITKAGDEMLRTLLVNCAHHILGVHGQDSDLRRWGLELARAVDRKGKQGARKLAATAVARKLAVLLHRLWVTGAKYEPLRNRGAQQTPAA
jgi:transposase